MNEKNSIYRMKALMDDSDLDTLNAQKAAGSRTEYFALLDNFVETEPKVARELEQRLEEGDYRETIRIIGGLQDTLMRIGATLMTWEAQRLSELVRGNMSRLECMSEAVVLTTRLNTLRSGLLNARFEKPEDFTGTLAAQHPVQSSASVPSVRQQAVARSDSFEMLLILIENFEVDDALAMIGEMLTKSYGKEIDNALVKACDQLTAFEFESALETLRAALVTIHHNEDDLKKSAKKVILAVDDIPDVLNAVKAVLGKTYNVYGVTTHQAAIKFLTGRRADLILLDIEMPQMDGFAMLGIIRRMKAYESTPVLFLTGNVNMNNLKKSLTMGANDFIRKPVDAAVLNERVKKHLQE